MLAAIQGARSAEFEPENFIDSKKDIQNAEKSLIRASPAGADFEPEHVTVKGENKGLKVGVQPQGRGSRETNNDSPTLLSDEDDTSFSTWKAPVCLNLIFFDFRKTVKFYKVDLKNQLFICM